MIAIPLKVVMDPVHDNMYHIRETLKYFGKKLDKLITPQHSASLEGY